MSADLPGSGIRTNLAPRKRFRFALPFLRRSGDTSATASPRLPRRVACARAGCANTVVDEWEESGLLCAECALEEDLCDRESRWDRIYPGR
jgi:hypothetical protein